MDEGIARRMVSRRGVVAASLLAPAAGLLTRSGVGAQERDLGLPRFNSAISIKDNGPADPYGSTITVSGVKGFITDVNLILLGLRHDRPSDIGVMLDHGGRAAIVMRGAGGNSAVTGANIVLDDQAGTYDQSTGNPSTPVPNTARLDGGRPYQPFDYGTGKFGGGAPDPSADSPRLRTFNGLDANGQWTLWVRDDVAQIGGSLAGWQLEIVTDSEPGNIIVVNKYRVRQDQVLRVSAEEGLLGRFNPQVRDDYIVRLVGSKSSRLKLREDGSFTYEPSRNKRAFTFDYTVQSKLGSSIQGTGRVNVEIFKPR